MKRIYAIGDIHGCYDKLCRLIDRIDIRWSRDTLVLLGDYIDRGPRSYEVLEYLIALKKEHPDTIFLKGNHEAMFLDFLSGTDTLTYLYNGGQRTLDSYYRYNMSAEHLTIPKEHLDFLNSLVLCHQTEDYIFAHAGVRSGIPLSEQVEKDLLWIREPFVGEPNDFEKTVVFGHTPFPEPLVQPGKIGIDTGAVYGNRLTCVRLPDMTFFDDK
jgi:serine/threonine protein phosphatase 1